MNQHHRVFGSNIFSRAAAVASIGLATAAMAAPATTPAEAPGALFTPAVVTAPSAQQCMNDLRAIDSQMQTAGTWVHGTGYGYGYPVYGYGYGFGYPDHSAHNLGIVGTHGHTRARPGYEIRTLIAAATILAQKGQQQECNDLLAATRVAYKEYADDLHDSNVPKLDGPAWRRQQIASAVAVTHSKKGYRSDQLIGADVVNAQGDDLGDIYDIVTSPQTGKIEYLVLGRGGVFGIGQRHIPVPWEAFKVSADTSTLVLDSTKSNLDAAPTVAANHFSPHGNIGQQGQNVDAFWKTRILK
jgi:sporulation protein YlmC with PRC-barrel domain